VRGRKKQRRFTRRVELCHCGISSTRFHFDNNGGVHRLFRRESACASSLSWNVLHLLRRRFSLLKSRYCCNSFHKLVKGELCHTNWPSAFHRALHVGADRVTHSASGLRTVKTLLTSKRQRSRHKFGVSKYLKEFSESWSKTSQVLSGRA